MFAQVFYLKICSIIYKIVLTKLHEIAAYFSKHIYLFFHYLLLSFILWNDLNVETKKSQKIWLHKYFIKNI